jgi:hypothetical protein
MSNNTSTDQSRIDSAHPADDDQHRASEKAATGRERPSTPASAHESDRDAIAGSLNNVQIQMHDNETTVTVSPIRDEPVFTGVDLRWKTDTASIGVALDTTAARTLIDELQSVVDAVDNGSHDE